MALSPEYIAKLEAFIAKVGPRQAAVKMIDSALESLMGLSSADLADSVIFANGLDTMEDMISQKQYDRAMKMGREVAQEMVKDEGGGDDWLDRMVQGGGHLEEVKKMVKEAVQERLKK